MYVLINRLTDFKRGFFYRKESITTEQYIYEFLCVSITI